MAMALTGRQILDIHTAGEDNIFPHNECEIAQSCGATGQPRFAKLWMHARHLLVDGQKMSKSKGNFYTVRDLMEGRATGVKVHPAVIRYELIKGHYRSNINFTFKGLEDSAGAVEKLRNMALRLEKDSAGQTEEVSVGHPVLAQFIAALSDDLNIAGAMGGVIKWLGDVKDSPPVALSILRKIDSVIQVLPQPISATVGTHGDYAIFAASAEIGADSIAKQIDAARAAKDFATADRLRKELIDAGYDVMTTQAGTTARRKLA